MNICVLQPSYEGSTFDYQHYDPPRDLSPLLPEHTVYHAFLKKVSTFRQLRDLKKQSAEVIREESEKTPMAHRVHASFTKFQALVGPWEQVAEGAYHQLMAL